MSSYTEIVRTNGRHRVRLVADDDTENPRVDYEHLDHVITVNASFRYQAIDGDFGPLAKIWDRLETSHYRREATEIFQRYCAITHRAVTLHDDPYNASQVAIWYLMAEDLHEVQDPIEYLKAQRNEYRSWAEGDVWGHVVEELQTWRRVDPTTDDPAYLEERVTWEEVDSCYGFVGYAYAKEEALSALDSYTKYGHSGN